jgi:P-type Cu+ transporter
MSIDPVCSMTVDPEKAAGKYEYDGKTYYFCSTHCVEKFRSDPQRFLGSSPPLPMQPITIGRARTSVESDKTQISDLAVYTCPMHPEVRQQGAGSCPKCGMALEPLTVAVESERVEYTCPMHPEVVRDRPGSCPICGMALEPRVITLNAEENHGAT